MKCSRPPQGLAPLPQRRSRQNRSQMLSGHRRARLPLNQNATSVKKNSFIIAKISWHFQYHKDSRKFAVANFASIACALLLMRQINALPINARSARQNTLLHIPSAADPSTSNTDKEIAPKATPPPSLLSNYALESSNNEQAMLSTAVVFICGSDGSRRACRALWIADRKRTS